MQNESKSSENSNKLHEIDILLMIYSLIMKEEKY